MKTCIVIGAHGFIGSAIVAEAQQRGYAVTAVDRDNYEAQRGASATLLINANGNSRKFIDERDPAQGFELSVSSVLNALLDFKFDQYIQISSGAIYPREDNPQHNREDTPLQPAGMSRMASTNGLRNNWCGTMPPPPHRPAGRRGRPAVAKECPVRFAHGKSVVRPSGFRISVHGYPRPRPRAIHPP